MEQVKTYFASDNFTSRRTTGHNMFDPESFITGAELAAGFTYTNSHREFASQETYDAVVSGTLPPWTTSHVAPRVFNDPTAAAMAIEVVMKDARREARKVLSALYGAEERGI